MSDDIIPFGKLKGKPVYALAEDKSYSEWLLTQAWFKEKHLNIYNIVINNYRTPDDTPEHNKLQIQFLNQDYSLKLAYHLEPNLFHWNSENINHDLNEYLNSLSRGQDTAKSELNKRDKIELLKIYDPTFEAGYDVSYSVRYGVSLHFPYQIPNHYEKSWFSFERSQLVKLQIEIKPTISDDFPSVLRQMKASMPGTYEDCSNKTTRCLLVGSYTGVGATKEQFVKFFQTQNYRVIFTSDIEKTELPIFDDVFKLQLTE